MTDNRGSCNQNNSRETVCIETNRVLDSCKDRDCFEDVRVILTDYGQEIIEHSNNVRAKCACVADTHISVEPVQFNRGFYQVVIRFFVKITCEACVCPGRVQEFEGIAVVDKKVVLFGSESNVSIFKSDPEELGFCPKPSKPGKCQKNVPTAVVEVVDPIVLDANVMEKCDKPCTCCCCCCASELPENVSGCVAGALTNSDDNDRYLTVSLGFFSVVRIVRPAQYLVNAVEYSVPDKECVGSEENDPCSIFKNMEFPTSEFSPPSYSSRNDKKCGCGN